MKGLILALFMNRRNRNLGIILFISKKEIVFNLISCNIVSKERFLSRFTTTARQEKFNNKNYFCVECV